MRCTKAIIPVAGYGARRLPITKAIEKCMLPILNRPLIDYVIQDCIQAGVKDIYIVVSVGGGQQIRQFYAKNEAIEAYLVAQHKDKLLPLVAALRDDVRLHFVEQDTTQVYGTTVPVWLCRQFINPDEQVLVLMGDDFIYNSDGSSETKRLVEAAANGSAMIGVPLAKSEVSHYGVIATKELQDGTKAFTHIQEKPTAEEAASNLINVSKYIFDYAFFAFVEAAMATDASGGIEHLLTDPLNDYVNAGHSLRVLEARGEYLDSGTVENWLAANQFVAQHTL